MSTASTTKITASTTKMPFLPEELVLGILSRIPTRSVMRFRLVCNAWDKLITDPYFARIHSRAPIYGFFSFRGVHYCGQDVDEKHASYTSFTGDGGGGIPPPMAKTLLSEGFVADSSCNGLICFHKDSRIIICDPFTETSATIDDSTVHLPRPTGEYTWVQIEVQLLYDLKVSTDFKIVKILCDCEHQIAFFHVFSYGSWRALPKTAPYYPLYCPDYVSSSCMREEGVVCWLESYECIVRVYDLGTDSLWELPLPPFDPGKKKKQRGQTKFLGNLVTSVSGKKVYLMRESKKKIVLWRLDGKERRWTLEFKGSNRRIHDVFSPAMQPLAYDDEERKVIMRAEDYTVQSYDLLNSKTEVIARDVGWFWHQNVVLHGNKPAPFSIFTAALVQS